MISKEVTNCIPEHTPFHYAIDLETRNISPWGSCYPLVEKELEVLRDWLKEMVETGNIRWSKLPPIAPILFLQKAPNRGL
jgi:hypothetical protein